MRAISIQYPWIGLILSEIKTHEVRTRYTKIREEIALHASKGMNDAAKRKMRSLDDSEREGLENITVRKGKIVGFATLADVVTYRDESEFKKDYGRHRVDFEKHVLKRPEFPVYAWVFEDVHKAKETVPFKGNAGFFNITEEDYERARFGTR